MYLLFCFVFLPACFYADIARLDNETYSPKPDTYPIKLTTSNGPKDCKEIAIINIDAAVGVSTGEINNELQARARNIGADMVVRINYGRAGEWGRLTVSGTAVRCETDPLKTPRIPE